MGMPKGYMTNINVKAQKIGSERRQQILDGIADKGTFLPRGVNEEDHDESFINFVKSDERMSLSIDGVKVPVIFLTIQRWSEFSKTWQFSDKYKNIELPFITIVRQPAIQQGTNHASLWSIPPNQTYTYMKVPTWDGVRQGIDLYKVPQPTHIDIIYEVRLFTNRMKDLNALNNKVQRAFQSRQCYIDVNGHPMPLHLETIGDESNIDDFENRRFYVQLFEIKLLGYLLNQEDFKIVPTMNRSMVMTELMEEEDGKGLIVLEPYRHLNTVIYTFNFKPKSITEFTFTAQYDASFSQLVDLTNISRIIIYINGFSIFDGTVLTTPIIFRGNDVIKVKVYKNYHNNGIFKLLGNTL